MSSGTDDHVCQECKRNKRNCRCYWPEDARLELERLRAALKPFADYAESMYADWPDDEIVAVGILKGISMGDCRRARDARKGEGKADG